MARKKKEETTPAYPVASAGAMGGFGGSLALGATAVKPQKTNYSPVKTYVDFQKSKTRLAKPQVQPQADYGLSMDIFEGLAKSAGQKKQGYQNELNAWTGQNSANLKQWEAQRAQYDRYQSLMETDVGQMNPMDQTFYRQYDEALKNGEIDEKWLKARPRSREDIQADYEAAQLEEEYYRAMLGQVNVYDRYNHLFYAPRFDYLSSYQPTGANLNPYATGQVMDKNRQLNLIYELLNDPSQASQSGYFAGYMGEHGYDLLNQEEKQIFNLLYNTKQYDAAWELLEDVQDILYFRRREEQYKDNAAFAEKYGGWASLYSLGTNLGATFMAPFQYLKTAVDPTTHRYDPIFDWNYQTQDIRQIRREEWEEIMPHIGSAVYDAVMGMGDRAMNFGVGMVLGGGQQAAATVISQYLAGSQTAGYTLLSALERGLSADQAIALGIGAGFADAVAEKFSLDQIFSNPASVHKYLGQTFLTGAGNEAMVGMVNTCYDLMISGDKAELMQEYKSLLASGISPQDATTQVLVNYMKNTGLDMLVGGLTDTISGGVKLAGDGVRQKVTGSMNSQNGPASNLGPVDPKKIPDFYTAVASLNPESPQNAQYRQFLYGFQKDFDQYQSLLQQVEAAKARGAAGYELRKLQGQLHLAESKLKERRSTPMFAGALGQAVAGEASEAAKVPEMGAEPTVNQAPRLMQPFNIFIKPNRQPAPKDAIIGAEWEHWSPAQQRRWMSYWQPNLPDHWSNSVNEASQTQILQSLERAPYQASALWTKGGPLLRGEYYNPQFARNAHFDPNTGKVMMDMSHVQGPSARLNLNSDLVTFLHESGHELDAGFKMRTGKALHESVPLMRGLMEKDLLNYANRILKQYGQPPVSDVRNCSPDQIAVLSAALSSESELFSSVSDLAEGITDGRIVGSYGHMGNNPYYWHNKYALEEEAIAHFNEAQILGGERATKLQNAFPQTMSYYNYVLKKREGKLK